MSGKYFIIFHINTYARFILDKFRLKFRELLSSCCCCCKSIVGMKSPSSTIKSYKPSSIHQASPMSANSHRRCITNHKYQPSTNSSLTAKNSGPDSIDTQVNHQHSHWTRPVAGTNAYSYHGPITCRLTNV
jgi:hypothetical protein